MLELIAGVFVAIAALALVLEPLVLRQSAVPVHDDLDVVELEESASPKVQALLALREIEFDHATGKLSDEDFQRLKVKYTKLALEAIKEERAGESGAVEDEAEALIRAMRGEGAKTCPSCGPRPEADAVFCSSCGRALAGPESQPRCGSCGSAMPTGSKFCAGCGAAVPASELEALHLS